METRNIEQAPTFISMNNKLFAEYFFVFRINDSYSISDFSDFSSKHQLLFQKIKNTNQQMNLIFIDSGFVNLLADLTLEVLLTKITSFQDYIFLNENSDQSELSNQNIFLTYKFSQFIHLLLYGDISSSKIFDQKLHTDRVFCFKNNHGALKYFSIYEQMELVKKMLNEMKIQIDFSMSTISNKELKLCLKFSF